MLQRLFRGFATQRYVKRMDNLPSLISRIYQSAYENKHLLFTDSTAKIIVKDSIQYSIRCAPALQHKPPKAEPRYKDEKPFNPFLPPDPNLKVLELQNHVIVLNKYCILPKHFLLVSKEFESQANDLSNQDISLLWECLEKMERDGERWLAFYNCGEASGASQQHKHAQFIPLPPREEFSPFPDHVVLRNEDHESRVPFRHYISRLPQNKDAKSLFNTYRELLRNMRGESEDGDVSYNFVMTTEWMFISPREKDDYRGEQYKIAVNSTGMVGLLLTKSPEESDFLERVGPATILGQVGKPWSQARNEK